MLNSNKIIAALLIMCASINAYEFSFFNKTSTPIAIAIQFANSENEPLYKLYIKQNAMKSFVPGTIDIPDIKWSFCLKNISYIKNPTMQERAHNFGRVTHWKKIGITWSNKPLSTTPEPKRLPLQHKIQKNVAQGRILVQKKKPPVESKSLCKDRHFEITEDEHHNIIITGSTVE
jgi:hypothetical protein